MTNTIERNTIRLKGTLIILNENLALFPHGTPRNKEECLPEKLEVEQFYKFKLNGCQVFPIGKDMDLVQIIEESDERLLSSKPLAKIEITNANQYMLANSLYTNGEYYVIKLLE